ncbi:hypothetical protein EC991_006737 [Linnemannia zychae]|nr:hypothetical protein EC991_006737 [Linnemannia zychae]
MTQDPAPAPAPTRSIVGTFYSNLLKFDTKALNALNIKDYEKWERRVIDAERKRRKSSGDTVPSGAEKGRILSIGEGKAGDSPVTIKIQKPIPASWSLYPELSENVDGHLKKPFTFYSADIASLALKEYDTFVSGVFLCVGRCSNRSWSSGKIAISIRMYDRDRYNARIHHQRCRDCNALSRPTLDADTYAERVSYRLNKWSGFEIVLPSYTLKPTPPHDCANCEACRIGRCHHDKDEAKYSKCRKNCRSDR